MSEYKPDYVSSPGDTLMETLEVQGMARLELSQKARLSYLLVCNISRGKAVITPEIAEKLEFVLGISIVFWLSREKNYRDWLEEEGE